jgi:predicted dehydrogenase
MTKTRVVVIGAGAIAQRRHLPEYAGRNDVELVGLVDINTSRAEAIAKKFNVPAAFTDYRDALKLQPDAVSVCTPNVYHAEQSIAALRCGAHVLCEKPMALTVKDVRAMIAAGRKARRQVMIGHNQRLNDSHVRGKDLYRSGVVGKCVGFSTTFCHGGPDGWSVDLAKGFFFKKKLAGLGALADLGVHKVDFVRWFLDDEIESVAAMSGTLVKKHCEVDDTAFAVLRMRSGILGQMFAGWIGQGGNGTQFYCEGGKIMLETDPNFPVVVERKNGERICLKLRTIQTNESGGQYGSGVIDNFITAIRAGKKVPIPGEEGGQSVAAILAAVQSAATGRAVKVAKV